MLINTTQAQLIGLPPISWRISAISPSTNCALATSVNIPSLECGGCNRYDRWVALRGSSGETPPVAAKLSPWKCCSGALRAESPQPVNSMVRLAERPLAVKIHLRVAGRWIFRKRYRKRRGQDWMHRSNYRTWFFESFRRRTMF